MSLVDSPEPERPDEAVETALWCNSCMLPSGMQLELPVFDPATGVEIGKQHPIFCVDCGAILTGEGDVIG